jgi:stonin-1/2
MIRFWKKVFVKLVNQGDSPVLQLYNTRDDKDPFQELPLQASYNISDIGVHYFIKFGSWHNIIHTWTERTLRSALRAN